MYTLETLEQKLKELGKIDPIGHLLIVKPKLPTLLKTLGPDDTILACSLKCVENSGPGMLVVLQDRMIFMHHMSLTKSQIDIYLKNIASFQNHTKRIPMSKVAYCDISITDNGGRRYTFSGIVEEQATRIINILNDNVKISN